MNKNNLILFSLAICLNSFSQEATLLLKEVKQQTRIIDSLRKNEAKHIVDLNERTRIIDSLKKNENEYRVEFKRELNILKDSITVLKQELKAKDDQIISQKSKSINDLLVSKEKGREEILAEIKKFYNNQSFDDLIQWNTVQSVINSYVLFKNESEIKLILTDLKLYYNSVELLNYKYDNNKINYALVELNKINRKSKLLDKLRRDLNLYKNYIDGLKNNLVQIKSLDEQMPTSGVASLQQRKFYKISEFLFNYDYNLYDYPYLSSIVLEIIKRKFPDADANIQDLLDQLN